MPDQGIDGCTTDAQDGRMIGFTLAESDERENEIMEQREIQQQALANARNGQSFANYAAIFEGFMEKGIPESDILPRENVFTFHAWKALGRQVRKGEHGVKVCTYVPMDKVTEENGERKVDTWKAPRMTTVFHISQTDPVTH